MYTELHIFDFDGTLFNSPTNTDENQKKYEDLTGIPWKINASLSKELSKKLGREIPTRHGWWGRYETLQPPLVPNPAPKEWFNQQVVDDFLKSKSNPYVLTCVMTGRHVGLKKDVLRILNDGNLLSHNQNIPCYCLGDSGPLSWPDKPTDTLNWKIWMTKQLVSANKEINKIVFWEDRTEHIPHFYNLNNELKMQVNVIEVSTSANF